MDEFKNITALVRYILEKDKQCRNSDSLLYLRVIVSIGNQKGIDLEEVTVRDFFLNLHGKELPPFESVRRARQKVQAKYPELASNENVRRCRAERERRFRIAARM